MHLLRRRSLGFLAVVCMAAASFLVAAHEPNLTKDEIKQFLLTAKVVNSRHTSKGITSPWRLTLSDGKLTHDATFQAVDEHKTMAEVAGGATEFNFVDSYKYNIAAYILAELLGLEDMLPVTVERKWQGHGGSLSWWLPVKMDEAERVKRKIEPPDADAWNKQVYKIRVLAQLVYDTDLNQTNLLITEDWKLWRIDFTRAFRLHKALQNPTELVRCDRQLLEKLKKLDATELEQKTKHYLTKPEVQAVMARRDKIVEHFQMLIAQKGEGEILY